MSINVFQRAFFWWVTVLLFIFDVLGWLWEAAGLSVSPKDVRGFWQEKNKKLSEPAVYFSARLYRDVVSQSP